MNYEKLYEKEKQRANIYKKAFFIACEILANKEDYLQCNITCHFNDGKCNCIDNCYVDKMTMTDWGGFILNGTKSKVK